MDYFQMQETRLWNSMRINQPSVVGIHSPATLRSAAGCSLCEKPWCWAFGPQLLGVSGLLWMIPLQDMSSETTKEDIVCLYHGSTNFWLGPNNQIIVTWRSPCWIHPCILLQFHPARRKRILLGMPTRGPTIIRCRAAGCIDSFWLLACSKKRLQSLSKAGIWSHNMTSSMIIFLQVDYVNRCYWLIHAIYLLHAIAAGPGSFGMNLKRGGKGVIGRFIPILSVD